jgi:hypothetical protein
MNDFSDRGLGFVKDLADERDLTWRAVVAPQSVSVPTKHRLSALGTVLNQGDKPYCVGYSTASLKMHQEFKEHKKYYTFDPDWLYAECKKVDGYNGDGTYLRVALKIIQETGYLAKAERYKLKDNTNFKIEKYVRLTSKQQIREALYHIGPVVFGITVDEGIYAPVRGIVAEPHGKEQGGHAMLIVGYDDNKKCHGSRGAFRIKNSWGKEWGSRGFAWLPYSHFDHYTGWDAWRSVDTKDLLLTP